MFRGSSLHPGWGAGGCRGRKYEPPCGGRGGSRWGQTQALTEDAECGRMFLFSPGPAPPPPKRLIHLPGKQGERSGFRAEGVVGCRAALTAPLKTPLWRAGLRLAPAPAATPPVTRDRGGVLGGRERTRGSSLRSDELPGRVKREPRGDIASQDDPAGCISVLCSQPRAPSPPLPCRPQDHPGGGHLPPT